MKVQHILTNENEFIDAARHQHISNFTLQEHDVVVQAVVPLTHQFNDAVAGFVVGIEELQVEGGTAHAVPLRMDEMIVYGIGKLKLAVFPAVKGRLPVGGRGV